MTRVRRPPLFITPPTCLHAPKLVRSLIVPSKHRSGCLLHPTEETLGQVPDEFAREHPSDLRPLQLPAGNQPGGPLSPSRRESKGVCTVRFRQPSQSLLVAFQPPEAHLDSVFRFTAPPPLHPNPHFFDHHIFPLVIEITY